RQIGFDEILRRGVAAADGLPSDAVYAGFSLGAMPAQKLAQTRLGALAAILYHNCMPLTAFGPEWPMDVAVQIHVRPDDKWLEEDMVAAEELVRTVKADGGEA